MSDQLSNIYLAMAAIMSDIEAIGKDKENKDQGFKFRGIEDVMNELHPIFKAHGVICLPRLQKIEIRDAGVTKSGVTKTRAIVEMGYRFTATDGSFVDALTAGEGLDSSDKSTAKSMSVAFKYALTQTFLIPTADVVEGDYYSPTVDAREELSQINKDRRAMEAIMNQHLSNAELAESDQEKRRLLGLASEMRCKIADLDVEPKTAETAEVKPEQVPATPKRKKEAAKPEPEPAQSVPWNEVECHIGKSTGPLKGKKLGVLFGPTKTASNIKGLMEYFEAHVGQPDASDPQDVALWNAVKEAETAWKASQAPQPAKEPAEPQKPAETAPEPTKPATAPASASEWASYVINAKALACDGEKLGDLETEEIEKIATEYLPKIAWDVATTIQKKLKAMVTLALAERKPEIPEHTHQLIEAVKESNLNRNDVIPECKRAGWISTTAQRIEDITEDEAASLLADWPSVVKQISRMTP